MSNMSVIAELKGLQQRMLGLSGVFELSDSIDFIGGANLKQCLVMVEALAERVVDLTGCAQPLEDAAVQLKAEIEAEDMEPHTPHCGCDACHVAGSDEHFDRWKDGLMMGA